MISHQCEGVFFARMCHSRQPPIPGFRALCSEYNFLSSILGGYPVQVPPKSKRYQNERNTHTHNTAWWRSTQRQESKDVTCTMNEQQSPQSPNACSSKTSSKIIQSPYPSLSCTLAPTTTHPAQRSSPEGSLVHALDADH